MSLRLSRQSVGPDDFPGAYGVCQNLDCLAPLEPPFIVVTFAVPGGSLGTVLCCNCAPEDQDQPVQIRLVTDPPVLELPG
jgi:hypothetical protein